MTEAQETVPSIPSVTCVSSSAASRGPRRRRSPTLGPSVPGLPWGLCWRFIFLAPFPWSSAASSAASTRRSRLTGDSAAERRNATAQPEKGPRGGYRSHWQRWQTLLDPAKDRATVTRDTRRAGAPTLPHRPRGRGRGRARDIPPAPPGAGTGRGTGLLPAPERKGGRHAAAAASSSPFRKRTGGERAGRVAADAPKPTGSPLTWGGAGPPRRHVGWCWQRSRARGRLAPPPNGRSALPTAAPLYALTPAVAPPLLRLRAGSAHASDALPAPHGGFARSPRGVSPGRLPGAAGRVAGGAGAPEAGRVVGAVGVARAAIAGRVARRSLSRTAQPARRGSVSPRSAPQRGAGSTSPVPWKAARPEARFCRSGAVVVVARRVGSQGLLACAVGVFPWWCAYGPQNVSE